MEKTLFMRVINSKYSLEYKYIVKEAVNEN